MWRATPWRARDEQEALQPALSTRRVHTAHVGAMQHCGGDGDGWHASLRMGVHVNPAKRVPEKLTLLELVLRSTCRVHALG